MTSRQKLIVAAAVVLVVAAAGALAFRDIPATASAPLFLLIVIVEVVVAPIPGGAVGYLGAARFGFWHAWPLLYIGNVIGTVTVFYLARRLGAPIFEENVSEKTRARYNRILDRHPRLLWLVYSVPLIPVDLLSVLAGLSRIRARRFFLIALTGYVFYTGIVAFIGSSVAQYIGVTEAMSIFGLILFVGIAWWLWRGQRKEQTPVRVGLTGNIASGKSAVAAHWQSLGAAVIDADELARRAVDPGTAGLERVVEKFGRDVLTPDGALDRAAMRRLVFTNEAKRRALEDIVHPEVERLRQEEERRALGAGHRVIVHMIPLLYETGLDERFDVVVLVDAPEPERLERIMRTRGLDEAEARAMIAAQMPSHEKRRRAHFVIDNHRDLHALNTEAARVWTAIEEKVR